MESEEDTEIYWNANKKVIFRKKFTPELYHLLQTLRNACHWLMPHSQWFWRQSAAPRYLPPREDIL